MDHVTIVPGIYRHYKGPLYNVMGLARHANTGEMGVVYHGLEPHVEECVQAGAIATQCYSCGGMGGHKKISVVPMWNWRPLEGPEGFLTPVNIDPGGLTSEYRPKLVDRFHFLHSVNSTRTLQPTTDGPRRG